MGVAEKYAHSLADDRKWKEVETLLPIGIATIVFGDYDVASANADDWLSKGKEIYYQIHPDRRPVPDSTPKRNKLGILNWWWGEASENILLNSEVEEIFYGILSHAVGKATVDVDDDIMGDNDSSMDAWFQEGIDYSGIDDDDIFFYMENRFSRLGEFQEFARQSATYFAHPNQRKLYDKIERGLEGDGWSEAVNLLLTLMMLEWDSIDLNKPFMLIPSEKSMEYFIKNLSGFFLASKEKYEVITTEQPLSDFINPNLRVDSSYNTISYKVMGIRTEDGKRTEILFVSIPTLTEGYYCVSPEMNAWAAGYCSQKWPELWKQFLHL